jgi:hypothetical protein
VNIADRTRVEPKYLSCAETAQLVRAALKRTFPGVTFSVRSSTYSGGASITVSWTDGPTYDEVNRIAHGFSGASFDGMIDLKSYHVSVLDGQPVHFGADFVFCTRQFSDALVQRAARYANVRYGWTLPIDHMRARESNFGLSYTQAPNKQTDLVWRIARTMRPNGNIITLKGGA